MTSPREDLIQIKVVLAMTLFGLSGCPPAPAPDAGTCGVDEVFVAEPLALPGEGDVPIAFIRSPQTDDGATLALVVNGRELGTRPLSREASWLVPLDAGEVALRLTLTCPNAAPAVLDSTFQVYPRVELAEVLPRTCEVLSPVGPDALDCDGVVVTLDGGVVPGRLVGTSRSFWVDGGWGRWVQTDDGLHLETTGGTTSPVPVPPSEQVVVTGQFAFMMGLVVRSVDGGLVSSSVDAGGALDGPADFVPCAAAVVGGREWVAFCVQPFLVFSEPPAGDDPFVVCELVGSSMNCSTTTGVFVGQDQRTREVVLRRGDEFVRFELGQQAPTSARLVRPGEATFRAPTSQTGDGRQGRMYRGGGVTGFLLPGPALEPFVVRGVGIRASSELVWAADEDAGLTRFSRLRQP